MRLPGLWEAAQRLVGRLGLWEAALRSPWSGHPVVELYRSLGMSARLLAFTLMALPGLYWLLGPPSLLALAVPAAPLASTLYRLRYSPGVVEQLRAELYAAAAHVAALAAGGAPPAEAVSELASAREIHPATSGYAARALLYASLTGVDVLTALEEVASRIPFRPAAAMLRSLAESYRVYGSPRPAARAALAEARRHFQAWLESSKTAAAVAGLLYTLSVLVQVFLLLLRQAAVAGGLSGLASALAAPAALLSPFVSATAAGIVYARMRVGEKRRTVPSRRLAAHLLASGVFVAGGAALLALHLGAPGYVAAGVLGAAGIPLGFHAARRLSAARTARREFARLLAGLAAASEAGVPLEAALAAAAESLTVLRAPALRAASLAACGIPLHETLPAAVAEAGDPLSTSAASIAARAWLRGRGGGEVLRELSRVLEESADSVEERRRSLRGYALAPLASVLLGAATLLAAPAVAGSAAGVDPVSAYSLVASAWLGGFMVSALLDGDLWSGLLYAGLLSLAAAASLLLVGAVA